MIQKLIEQLKTDKIDIYLKNGVITVSTKFDKIEITYVNDIVTEPQLRQAVEVICY